MTTHAPRWAQAKTIRAARQLYVDTLAGFGRRELLRLCRSSKLSAHGVRDDARLALVLWHYVGRYRWADYRAAERRGD